MARVLRHSGLLEAQVSLEGVTVLPEGWGLTPDYLSAGICVKPRFWLLHCLSHAFREENELVEICTMCGDAYWVRPGQPGACGASSACGFWRFGPP